MRTTSSMSNRSNGEQLLILIAEKDPFMREVERRLLDDAYRLEFVNDGVTALHRARELLPDLVVTEVLLPKLDGLEVTRQLRHDPITRLIPILVFSLLAAAERALAAGATAYLRKPVAREQFVSTVESLLLGRISGVTGVSAVAVGVAEPVREAGEGRH
jgi:CheY-like chemotaxis protein